MGEEAQKQFQPTARDHRTPDGGLFTYSIFFNNQKEEKLMSRSYARNANTASLITLCPVCLHSFQDAKKAFLRRADIRQQTKDVCTYCQTRYGFDYYVQPAAAHRDTTRRKVRTYVPASNH